MIGALVRRVYAPHSLPAGSSAEQTLAVLVGARSLVARGWLQGGWYVLEAPDGRRRFVGAGSLTRRSFGEIRQSCLVGAVVEAARWHTAEKGVAGPAIDRLWHELGELCARPQPVDPWTPTPVVRSRQVGELTTWNDDPARTRDDVLQLLGAAIAGLTPAPGPASGPASEPAGEGDTSGAQSRSASTAAARSAPSVATGR
jgi:hypothetical protein